MTDAITRRSVLGLAVATLVPTAVRAADASQRREVARRLAEIVRREYQDPARGEAMAAALEARLAGGAYDAEMGDAAFASALTAHLQAAAPDRHLAVMANVGSAMPELSADPVFSVRQNYGVQAVRRLGGNVGLIELNFAPGMRFSDAILDRYAAAMALVRDTRALLVDLRRHMGGEPETVAYFVSYFFDRAPFVVNRIRHRNKPTVDYRTVALPRGPKYGERRPVFVLTSADTFSGGEELAYDLQATGRARIVGDRTGGGANPNEAFDIGRGFGALIPVGAAVNPVTGGNWEGIGVKPDVEVEAAKALDSAWRLALEAALAQATSDDDRSSIAQALSALPR
jgi:hypothetical protein